MKVKTHGNKLKKQTPTKEIIYIYISTLQQQSSSLWKESEVDWSITYWNKFREGTGEKMKAFKIENPSTELGMHVCHTEVSVLNKNKEKERLKDLSYAS